jgi:hypothetical protein
MGRASPGVPCLRAFTTKLGECPGWDDGGAAPEDRRTAARTMSRRRFHEASPLLASEEYRPKAAAGLGARTILAKYMRLAGGAISVLISDDLSA